MACEGIRPLQWSRAQPWRCAPDCSGQISAMCLSCGGKSRVNSIRFSTEPNPGRGAERLLSRIRAGQTCTGCQLAVSARFFPFYSSTDSSHTAALPPNSQSEQLYRITTQLVFAHLVETGWVQEDPEFPMFSQQRVSGQWTIRQASIRLSS